jgi:ABC-type nitrate/sulfonate/bicarbonate transport system ATPase subunit
MLLSVNNLNKSFGNKTILHNLSFSLKQGGRYGLIGRSGCGKSLLFNILAGLVPSDSGTIERSNEAERPNYMQQNDLLLPHLTLLANVSLPLILGNKITKKEAYAQAQGYFARFGLAGYELAYPAVLSGGMRQRANLLRAFLFNRPFWLMDEPFSALDYLTALDIRLFLKEQIKALKISLFFISHNIDEVIELCEEIFVMPPDNGPLNAPLIVADHNKTDLVKIILGKLGVKA